MEFNKAYNRAEFLSFLRTSFLPEDFQQEASVIDNPVQFQYTQQVTRLGECESLGLVVYEVRHSSKHDARVGLTKEAFRLLADEFCERALVFFVPEDDDSNYRFSLIEITLDQSETSSRVSRRYSNPHRYSYYLGKGIAYYTPNKYLNEYGRVVNVEDLRNRFSVEVLTKAFYQELSDWYAWAIMIVRFPNDLKTLEDNQKYNSEAMIRLITRLIFVWFLKQRHLVPDEFFDEQFIANELIKDFTPHAIENLFGKSYESKYYKGVLQNLFFAMLNSPITPEGKDTISERRFRNGRGDYDNNKLMRHEDLFINPDKFVELANKYVPFLNGGLFDCLDDKDNGMYVDAFTDRKIISDQLVIPDFLFFGEEAGKNIDLSEYYGNKKKKKVSARGIIDILKRYNFTVEENTPFDQEVSLDPELLGKVFENLLAAYNPETQTTARKQTGSFYTPREIVQYMVDESLVAHLKRTVGEDLEPEYRKLIQYTDEEPQLTDEQKCQIMQSLYNCKVLDPACGSGAFPMGMLQQMVHILGQLDPNNEQWKDMMLSNAIEEAYNAEHGVSEEEEKEIKADIFRSFDENLNRPDYARKLYLIENCIYGVDIQPIAIQISKLRFFISLVVDQRTNNNPVDNFGIRPLPNLEAKFVAANTLINIEKRDADLFTSETILNKEAEMKDAKHRIFGAKTVKTKRKYKERVIELRDELANMLEDIGAVGNIEAQQLASWDMFDQNSSSPFFDSEWMFDINNSFDIVIGNPPYGVSIKGQYRKDVVKHLGNVPDYEIYYYFIQMAEELLADKGILSYIIPNTYLFNNFAKNYRMNILRKWNVIEILDCTKFKIFESATVLNTINTWQKNNMQKNEIGYRNTSNSLSFKELISVPRLKMDTTQLLMFNQNWGLAFTLNKEKIEVVNKLARIKRTIESCFPEISQGLIAYDKYQGQSDDIIRRRAYHYFEYKDGLKKWMWGEDVKRYNIIWNNKEYIDYCSGIANPRQPKFFIGKRLLIREITNPSIYASITTEELYNDPAIIIVKDSPAYSLEVVLAILNSKLATFYHFNHSPKATKGAFPKILVQDIKDFPLPNISEEQKDSITTNVNRILRMKSTDPNTDTSTLENEIDKKVYHLYGLTYDEVLIVDPETPITREEYEKNM
ncbi:Eco57I restriction-modification methylase domain-containing protein [Segatella bryantii]|uniref:site-specific DNA-methyltransferase (adenine-specific) n=1 Tax=Segatella bryantii TaxID=77095 RepID=A0ABX4EFU5_SEGBR|nr:TaqI-like C-terminal specificity domain-containing protein [Segatella bryantii]OYP54134.1 restriction endonuclease subunit M [Segatella bryantii]UKK80063.1 N-6 DNA methylase [Segatella bryantii]